jgi:hypothetical protein
LCLLPIAGLAQAADLSGNDVADIILSAPQTNKQRSSTTRVGPPAEPAWSFAAYRAGRAPLSVPRRVSVDQVEVPAGHDKHASYLFSLAGKKSGDPLVGLAKVDRVDIVQFGNAIQYDYRAEFMVGYKAGSVGSILFGMAMQFERPGETSFRLLDDGWRLKLLKRF